MHSQTLFASTRLWVRPFCDADIDDFFDMQSNPNVMRYIKSPMDYEQSQKELKRFMDYYYDQTQFFHIWAVLEQTNNHFVGLCGVYQNDKSEYEIAYRLREKHWGLGYGKEVAKGLIEYCFTQLDLTKLVAYVDKRNLGSVRILNNEMYWLEDEENEKKFSLNRKKE
jgi:ribosomal-protein-alanine N-acetyltransferase